MNTIKTIDAISSRFGGISDYKISKMMGMSRGIMSMYRTGKRKMSDEDRIKAAELLEQDPQLQLFYGRLERAKSAEVRQVWQQAIERISSTAAAFTLIALPAWTVYDRAVCILCQMPRRSRSSPIFA